MPNNVSILDIPNMVQLRKEIVKEEREVLKVYRDSLGKPTCGIGHLITPQDQETQKAIGTPITQARSTALYNFDIQRTINDVDKYLPWVKAKDPAVIRAIVNMAFQLGAKGVSKFTQTMQFIQDNDYESAYTSGLRSLWAKQTPGRARRVLSLIRNAPKGPTT